jgi:hypothetical protein
MHNAMGWTDVKACLFVLVMQVKLLLLLLLLLTLGSALNRRPTNRRRNKGKQPARLMETK